MWLLNKLNLILVTNVEKVVKCANLANWIFSKQLILFISCIFVILILFIVCVELKTKYHVCLMNLFVKMIHDTNILFGKNLEFRYMVPKINKIKNRHQLVLYFIFMRRVKLCIEKESFDGLLHNLIYWCTLTQWWHCKNVKWASVFIFYNSMYNWIAWHIFFIWAFNFICGTSLVNIIGCILIGDLTYQQFFLSEITLKTNIYNVNGDQTINNINWDIISWSGLW